MHPAIAFKSIGAFALGYKNKMIITVIIHLLRINHPVIIIDIAIITGGAYKLLIKNRNEIVIDIYILIHTAQVLDDAFIFYTIGIDGFYSFPPFKRFFLVIIIRDSFCKISRQVFHTFRAVNILFDKISNRS